MKSSSPKSGSVLSLCLLPPSSSSTGCVAAYWQKCAIASSGSSTGYEAELPPGFADLGSPPSPRMGGMAREGDRASLADASKGDKDQRPLSPPTRLRLRVLSITTPSLCGGSKEGEDDDRR